MTAACVAIVVLLYAFFATCGTWSFRPIEWFETHSQSPGADYYARLAEGFRTGHLYMAASVDPRLETLADPTDPDARSAAGIDALWDASYYRGHYYLYHSPLPVLLFYLPFRLIRGLYPPDSIAALFFCAWAFLFATLFLMRVLKQSRIPLALWVLLAGLGNVIAYSLPDVRVYEVAVMCGMAMSATWAWSLLRYLETPAARNAVRVGLWLALAIAARPNLAVLLIPTIIAIRPLRFVKSALLPLAAVMLILWSYNFARYGNPFELGVKYQIEFTSMVGKRVCSLCTTKEAIRFVNNLEHYLFWAPSFDHHFPFVMMQYSHVDPKVSAPLGADTILGVIALMPLVAFGTLFALMRPRRDAAVLVMSGAWLTLGALSTCWWIVARYSLDFMMLMTLATAVCIEEGLRMADGIAFRAATIVLAVYTVLLGTLLGFEGLGGSFRRNNPALFQQIGKVLHVKLR